MVLLIVNIGNNPIPNYAAVMYYCNKKIAEDNYCDKVLMIFSSDTERYFENIRSCVNKEFRNLNIQGLNFEDDPWDIRNIHSKINFFFNNNQSFNNENSIIFHYIGGTKPMVLYGFTTLNEKFMKKSLILSDIDPKAHVLQFYDLKNDDVKFFPDDPRKCLLDIVDINLKTLLQLHDIQLKCSFNKLPDYYEFTDLLLVKDIYQNPVLYSKFKKISDGSYSNNVNFKKDLKKNLDQSKLKSIVNYIEKKNYCKEECKEISSYITGKWLEVLIFDFVSDLNINYFQNKLHIYRNVEVQIPNPNQGSPRQTEIDVIFLYGYQIFLISITLEDDIKTAKMKGFEVVFRAKQLGGDNSKSILIANIKDQDKERVKLDLKNFNEMSNFDVFGGFYINNAINHKYKSDLYNELKEFIKYAIGK